MQDAPVIVADEPTANLDLSSSTTVLDVLDDVAGSRTLITVLHDMDLAVAHYDRLVGIVDGSIRFDRSTESTTADELEELTAQDDANTPAVHATEDRVAHRRRCAETGCGEVVRASAILEITD